MKKQPKHFPKSLIALCGWGKRAASKDSQAVALTSIKPKIGWTSKTLRRWYTSQQERATVQRPPPANAKEERVKALEREVRELAGQMRAASDECFLPKRSSAATSQAVRAFDQRYRHAHPLAEAETNY